MEETIESIISSDEKILWKGKRNKKILRFYLIAGLIITILIALFFFSQNTVEHFLGRETSTSGASIASFTIIIGFIVTFLIYYNKQSSTYVVTDKKIIVEQGWISPELNYAYHDKIRHLDISHGILGSMLNVGTIYVDSGKVITSEMRRKEIRGINMSPSKPKVVYYALKDIENPKRVYNLIERIIEKSQEPNLKADINEKQTEPPYKKD
jgi:hypothetical protein